MDEFAICLAFVASGALWFILGTIIGGRRATRAFWKCLDDRRRREKTVEDIVKQVMLNSHE